MTHRTGLARGNLATLIAVAVVALALIVPAVALAATPSVTIVGPGYVSATPPPTAAAPAVNDSYVELYLQDNGWGTDLVRFSNDGGTTWSSSRTWGEYLDWYMYEDLPVTQALDGVHTVTAQFSSDDGATWGAAAAATTMIDEQVPVMTAPEGYWNSKRPYTLSARDQIGLSGVQRIWYRIDTGPLTEVTTQQPLGTGVPLTAKFMLDGVTGTPHTIDYMAQDYAGNYSGRYRALAGRAATRGIALMVYATSAYVIIDQTAPTVSARGGGSGWHRGAVAIGLSAKDSDAGVNRIEYSVTGARAKRHGPWTSGNSVVVTAHGRHKVWFRAIDNALPQGNASAPSFVVVKIK